LVKPGGDKVIPLAPEFVQPQDGQATRLGRLLGKRGEWRKIRGGDIEKEG
jgi:hypothetical protein